MARRAPACQRAGRARRWRADGETMAEEVICGAPGWILSKNVLKLLFMRLGRHAGVSRLHLHLTSSATPTLAATCLPIATRSRIALMIRLGHTTPAMTNHYIRCILSPIDVHRRPLALSSERTPGSAHWEGTARGV
jgi:hypothetical protein